MQFGEFVELTFALQLSHLRADLFDRLFDVLGTLDLRLLRVPNFLKIGVLAFGALDFFFNQREPLLRSIVLFPAHRFPLNFQLNQAAVKFVHHLGLRINFHFDACRRFVDKVDRLIGKKTVSNVAIRQLGRRNNRRICDLNTVVQFVLLLQAPQNRDG